MTLTIALAFLAAAIVVLLFWMLRGALLLPIKPGCRQNLTIVLRSNAEAAELENTVRGLLWIIQNGTLPASVIIEDAGLDENAKKSARLLEKQYARITYHSDSEDHPWENRST